MQAGEAAVQNAHNILDYGSGRRGHNADAAWEPGQTAFAPRIEESFAPQFAFQLLERKLQRAEALGFNRIDQQLVLAPGFLPLTATAPPHGEAVLRFALQIPVVLAKTEDRKSVG